MSETIKILVEMPKELSRDISILKHKKGFKTKSGTIVELLTEITRDYKEKNNL